MHLHSHKLTLEAASTQLKHCLILEACTKSADGLCLCLSLHQLVCVQVGDVRQQLVEAHRRCSEQQGTIVQLHAQLLASRQHLQVC